MRNIIFVGGTLAMLMVAGAAEAGIEEIVGAVVEGVSCETGDVCIIYCIERAECIYLSGGRCSASEFSRSDWPSCVILVLSGKIEFELRS